MIVERKYDETLFLIQNSWGKFNSGPKMHEQPDGSFWVREKDAAGMLNQNGAWAFSDVDGFPPRKVDWIRTCVLVAASYKHIQYRRGIQKDFDNVNPKLKAGEAAFATDTNVLKVGDGVNRWRNLPEFVSSKKFKSAKISFDLPSISSGAYHSES